MLRVAVTDPSIPLNRPLGPEGILALAGSGRSLPTTGPPRTRTSRVAARQLSTARSEPHSPDEPNGGEPDGSKKDWYRFAEQTGLRLHER